MLEKLGMTAVGSVKRREPITLPTKATLATAIRTLRERRHGAALIVDEEGRLVGIFTERDLMLRCDTVLADGGRPIGELMSPRPVALLATRSVKEALACMHKGAFRHLPLVDEARRPVGVVTFRDLLRWIADLFPQEIQNLPPDPQHEAGGLYGG
jgi:CBS domain-containing protein